MDKYQISVITNRFHVSDDSAFEEFMDRVIIEDGGELELIAQTDADGLTVYGFAADGLIIGVQDEDETDSDDVLYDNFLLGLQELVDEGDAIIILETGRSGGANEKSGLQIYATATIVTTADTDYIDLQDVASDRAMELITRFSPLRE